jgi:hypothetical protein
LSQLVQSFLDTDQAGLEDPDVGLRVTSADSCPHFPGFVLLAQQLPKRGLRVTARPKQQETPPGDVAHGTPAAAGDPRRESPVDRSRDEHAPCASAARGHTPASSSSGFLQQIVGADTTSGSTDTVSTSPSSISPSTQPGRRRALASPATTPPTDPTPQVGLFWRADLAHFWQAPKPCATASRATRRI